MIFPDKEFTRVTPESKGIDSRAIREALTAIEASGKDIHSMLILRDGALVFEQYFAPYEKHIQHSMYSCSKTFTAMLIGIAQGKGLLSLHDKVLSYFPKVNVESPSDYLRDMALRDLLVMGSGHGEDTFGHMVEAQDGDWPRVFLNQAVTHKPGTHFIYNTGATYMLSNILTKVTGKTALELANEWLFRAIGIENAWWESDPKGISKGGTGLHIAPRDMARFGLLIQNEGRWGEVQVIPRDYVLEAQQKQIDNSGQGANWGNPNWIAGYGYQMWRCDFPAFRADGMGGQYIVMMPDRGLLFIFTSALGSDIAYPLTVIEEILLPGIGDSPLTENESAMAELEALSQRLYRPERSERPSAANGFPWNRAIVLDENLARFQSMTLTDTALLIGNGEATLEIPYGWGAPVISNASARSKKLFFFLADQFAMPIAAKAVWDNGLELILQFVGSPMTINLAFSLEGDAVSVQACPSITEGLTLTGKLK